MDFFRSRSFILSAIILACCLTLTFSYAMLNQKEFEDASMLLENTNEIIYETQDVSNKILSLITLQRGFILTQNEQFQLDYIQRQNEISNNFETLIEKHGGNDVLINKILLLQEYYVELSELLENSYTEELGDEVVNQVEALREQIRSVRNSFVDSKYAMLDQKINTIDRIQDRLVLGLFIGILLTGLGFTALNYYLFRLRRQNRLIGKDLFNSEERLQYAMHASGEGVFDWYLETGYIFYSTYFVEMLGYEAGEFPPTLNSFASILHPDDEERVWTYVDHYINDQLSEYSIEFRLKHANGRYVWINSRAYAIRDENRKALRIIGIHRDITEHKLVEETLEKEAFHAEQVAAAKGEFLAHMSHEIRTPLTTITGISEIMMKNQGNFNDRQKELLNTLSSSAKTLKELVNDILDFSKIEKGEVELEEQPFLLGNMMAEIISMMAVPANEKGLTFKVIYDDIKYYEYIGDEGRIKQILTNLIGNAIKFTDQGTITAMATIEQKQGVEYLAFNIQDTGVGIDKSMLEHVFHEFKQEDSSVSRKYGGTGLGLPISKKLASIMGGDISVTSQKGLGSTFTLYLPINNKGLALIDDNDLQIESKMTDKLASIIEDKQRALIVEDYEGNIVILSYLMEEVGLNFDVARTGQEALDMWKARHYNVILMDVQMPTMDGMTATKKIREMEAENNFSMTPIIGMTAHALIQDKDKCIDSGMNDYVSKPINSELLKEKIFKFINTNSNQNDIAEQKKTGT